MAALALLVVTSCSGGARVKPSADGPQPSGSVSSRPAAPTSTTTDFPVVVAPNQEGVQHLRFSFGPIKIAPGQNNIVFSNAQVPKPTVDGFIVAIFPNLVRSDGKVPPVDVIHLHHGVWLSPGSGRGTGPFFAAGEEKTSMILPAGYGYPYKATDTWIINYMLHNLLPTPDEVSVTYDLDFIPAGSEGAQRIKAARPIWMDVENGHVYPVFDVLKGTGAGGVFTFPDQASNPYGGRPLNEWTVDRDSVLLATAGHLHPGGLYTDLYLKRPGVGDKAHVFRSDAVYFEPAGAVSWDVSMVATPPDWRVAVKEGDVLSISATYDSARASWYESMGIMIVWMTDGSDGADPFHTSVPKGVLTHGHLPENDNHGGGPGNFTEMPALPDGPMADTVTMGDFTYAPGDMGGLYKAVPLVKRGGSLTFTNSDAPIGNGIWHTITACKSPCTGATGVAYPLADADVQFDSGELGTAGPPTAGRVEWSTPADLPAGTYTYFCRIHPSMRGAFRVDEGDATPTK